MGRRRMGRPAAGVAVLLLAVVALTGCKQDNTPTAYDDLTKANFIEGCTGIYVDSNGSTSTIADRQGASNGTCECAYDWFTKNVPYNTDAKNGDPAFAGYEGKTFVELNQELKTSPDKFPSEITAALTQTCPGFGGSASTPTTAGTGGPTTVAPSTSSSAPQ